MNRLHDLRADDGCELALHSWTGESSTAAVFYIHGLQSHAGWLYETGPALVARNVDVYALDRRGSGRSGGQRGHLPAADVVLDDYLLAYECVRMSTGLSLIGLGQSFGANLFAALLSSRNVAFEEVLFCTPALGTQRSRHGDSELARRRELSGISLHDVPLDDDDYTDIPEYREFMQNDPYMVRQVTASTQAVQVQLEDMYHDRTAENLRDTPVHLMLAEGDPIIDAPKARRVLSTFTPHFVETLFATSNHYLEFTDQRDIYWDRLAALAASRAA